MFMHARWNCLTKHKLRANIKERKVYTFGAKGPCHHIYRGTSAWAKAGIAAASEQGLPGTSHSLANTCRCKQRARTLLAHALPVLRVYISKTASEVLFFATDPRKLTK